MKLAVSVPFRNGLAHYAIIQEGKGVYLAQLELFEGALLESPPTTLTLTKSFRRWRGSTDDQGLIDRLGQAIENVLADNTITLQEQGSTTDEQNQPAEEV